MPEIPAKKQYLISLGGNRMTLEGDVAIFSSIEFPEPGEAGDPSPTLMTRSDWIAYGRPTEINVNVEIA